MTNASRGEFIPDPHVASASSRDRRMFLRLLVGGRKGPSKRMGAGGWDGVFGHRCDNGIATSKTARPGLSKAVVF
jgi:hypothetical protein